MPRKRKSRRSTAADGAGRPARGAAAAAAAARVGCGSPVDGVRTSTRRISPGRVRAAVKGVIAGARAVQRTLLSDPDGDADTGSGDTTSGDDDGDDDDGDEKTARHLPLPAAAAAATTAGAAAAVSVPRTRAAVKVATDAAELMAQKAAQDVAVAAAKEDEHRRQKAALVLERHNRERLKDLTPAVQGKPLHRYKAPQPCISASRRLIARSSTDRCYVLCAVYGCLLDGDQRMTAIRRVARWFCMAPATVAAVMDDYDPEKQVLLCARVDDAAQASDGAGAVRRVWKLHVQRVRPVRRQRLAGLAHAWS